jgi:ATP-dependent helicase YprA (DUF1998 family)
MGWWPPDFASPREFTGPPLISNMYLNFCSVASLSAAGLLHSDIADIFKGFSLYRHQVEAIRLGTAGKDFIVTSGTGSGKSLTYIGSIFHYLLSDGSTWRLYSFAGINPRRFQSTSMTFFINSPGHGQQRLISP